MFYPRPSDTSWVLTASAATISANSPVMLTAASTTDVNTISIPTGTVTFYDGCTVLGTATVNVATGTASYTTSAISTSGAHRIVAVYNGDSNFYHNNAAPISVTVQ
jgi:hypothetical protein